MSTPMTPDDASDSPPDEEAMLRTIVRQAKTAQESETALRTEGQRATSLVYESTQTRLALIAVAGFMGAHMFIVAVVGWVLVTAWDRIVEAQAVMAVLAAILTSALGAIAAMASLVAATYFQRTNSHKVGGVGKDHEGR